jgi:hypothetical protein
MSTRPALTHVPARALRKWLAGLPDGDEGQQNPLAEQAAAMNGTAGDRAVLVAYRVSRSR